MENLFKDFKIENPKNNYAEFQELGKEIQTWCGEKKFPLSLFMTYNHAKIKEGFNRIQKTEVHSIKYLVGIIKKVK